MTRAALSATRAIGVLDFLAGHPTESFSLSDLSDRLGVNLASMHAVLAVLTDAGYVVRHPRHRTYTLGPSAVALGNAALERHRVIDLARDAARKLADDTGLEVAVSAAAGTDIVFLARAGQHHAHGVAVHVGQRVPLVAPLGSVFMAWGGAEAWLADAPDPETMREVLEGVRIRGYAVALEHDARRLLGEALDHLADDPADESRRREVAASVVDLGGRAYQLRDIGSKEAYDVSMIAAPVFGATGEVALALTLLGFTPERPAADVLALGARVRDAGLVVTKASGGRAPSR